MRCESLSEMDKAETWDLSCDIGFLMFIEGWLFTRGRLLLLSMAFVVGGSELSEVVAREVDIDYWFIEVEELRKKVQVFRVEIFLSEV